MAGYSLTSPVTPNANKRKSLQLHRSSNGLKRFSTPRGGSTIKVQKAKFRQRSTFQSMERDTYLAKYIKPNININHSTMGRSSLFNFKEANYSAERPLFSNFQKPPNLFNLINSKGFTATASSKLPTSPLPEFIKPENNSTFSEEKINAEKIDRSSFYISKVDNWKISSKSEIFKQSLRNKHDLIYPSKTEETIQNNVNNIRDTRLVEKFNCLSVFKSESKSIVSSLKSFFAPFSSFKFTLRQFIPFQQIDHEISEEALITRKDELVPFTEEMEAEIFDVLASSSNLPIVTAFSINIHNKDLQTLHGSNWLNDGVIEFYLNLISSRAKSDRYPNVYAFGTFFYPALAKGNPVGRWARKLDFFSYDYLLVPIHASNHWRLTVVDNLNKRIEYYDSLGIEYRQAVDVMANFLQNESKTKKNTELDMKEWKLIYRIPGIPLQNNSYDCGVFACKYAEYIARKAPITFTQEQIPYFRKCMIYEIIHQKLLIDD